MELGSLEAMGMIGSLKSRDQMAILNTLNKGWHNGKKVGWPPGRHGPQLSVETVHTK